MQYGYKTRAEIKSEKQRVDLNIDEHLTDIFNDKLIRKLQRKYDTKSKYNIPKGNTNKNK